uniref:hypothetical protein n=1 Tax=Klebsiella pneumoniae TaxID=573 RepID=UPI0030097BF8
DPIAQCGAKIKKKKNYNKYKKRVQIISMWGFPGGSVVKNLPTNAGDRGFIPGSRRFTLSRKWQPAPVFLPGKSHG